MTAKLTELGVEWTLRWLGTGGYGSNPTLGMPSAVLVAGAEAHLFNAGDGTFPRLVQYVGPRRIDAIWLASCRSEFVSGLPGVLDGLAALNDKYLPTTVYGPYGLRELMPHVRGLCDYSLSAIEWKELRGVQHVSQKFAVISGVPVTKQTAIPTIAFRVSEPPLRGRFDAQAASALGIRPGPEFGRLAEGKTVKGVRPDQVMGPGRPGRRITFVWAGRSKKALLPLMKSAQLACIAAPFIDERQTHARQAGYLTGVEAAGYASQAGVEMLLLHHIAANVQPSYARDEAAQAHRPVRIPRAGDAFTVPLYGTGQVGFMPWTPRSTPRAVVRTAGPSPDSKKAAKAQKANAQEPCKHRARHA